MTRLFFWEEGYGEEEPEYEEPEPQRRTWHLDIPDEGCFQYKKCLACPLVECYQVGLDTEAFGNESVRIVRDHMRAVMLRSFREYVHNGDVASIEEMLLTMKATGVSDGLSPEILEWVREHEGVANVTHRQKPLLAHRLWCKGYTVTFISALLEMSRPAADKAIRTLREAANAA